MKVATAGEMRELDRRAIEDLGIPGVVLMENAGTRVVRVMLERYPDLKSNQNFLTLQSQLEGTENRIAVARRDYITAVQQYDTELKTFPGRIWKSVLYSEYESAENFTIEEAAKEVPKVEF